MLSTNQRGITIVSLVIVIIVILIISGIGISTGTDIIKKIALQTINTNMMLVQVKVKTISEQAKFNKEESNYKGQVLSQISIDKNIDELINNGVIDNIDKYYLLSQEDLNNMGLEKIDIEQGIVVNYDTEEVIYVKGFKQGNTTYYKLSETKNLNI